MAQAGTLEVVVTASIEGLKAGLKNAREELNKGASDWPKLGSVVQRSMTVAFGAAAAAATASVLAFAEAQKAATGLFNALQSRGQGREALQALLDQADALQQVSGFSDEAIVTAQKLLVTQGLLGNELQRTTAVAVNMAARFDMDVVEAANLLARATQGNTDRLSRYGVKIDETLPKALRFKDAIAQLEQITAGAGKARVQTLEGKFALAKENIGNAAEALGKQLAPTVERLFDYINSNYKTITKAFESIGKAVRDWLDDLVRVGRWMQANQSFFKTVGQTMFGAVKAMAGSPSDFITGLQGLKEGPGLQTPPTMVDTPETPLVPFGQAKRSPDQAIAEAQSLADQFSRIWQESFNQIFSASRLLADTVQGFMNGFVSTLSSGFQAVFQDLADGGKNLGDVLAGIGLGFRNLIFKVISDVLAKMLTAYILDMAMSKTAAKSKIMDELAVGQARTISAHAGIPFVGIAIGLAAAAALVAAISSIAQLAEGGFVDKPTLALIGERGPEAVVPLDKAEREGKMGGGGGGNTVIIQGQFLEADEDRWDDLVRSRVIPALAAYQNKSREGDFRRRPSRART